MALDVKLESPNGVTTIVLKASKVTERIQRKATNNPIPGNKTIEVDLGRIIKQFTITANLTTGGALDKAQLEALEDAAMKWFEQSSTNNGRTRFEWSTKADASAKDYRVIWISLDIVEDAERSPGSYTATILLEEAGDLSTSG